MSMHEIRLLRKVQPITQTWRILSTPFVRTRQQRQTKTSKSVTQAAFMTSRPPLTFQIRKTQRAPIYWKGLRSLGLFNEGTQDQGNQPRRMSSSSPSCGRRAPYFDGRDFFFFLSRLWLLINSPWQWAASLCLGGHCLSYYILFFHLDSIIIKKKILSGVISATNT